MVEQVTVNHKDVGSTPMSPANPRVVEARLNKRYAFWFCGKIRESMKSKNRHLKNFTPYRVLFFYLKKKGWRTWQ